MRQSLAEQGITDVAVFDKGRGKDVQFDTRTGNMLVTDDSVDQGRNRGATLFRGNIRDIR
jgi:hypothetical protein